MSIDQRRGIISLLPNKNKKAIAFRELETYFAPKYRL